MVGGVMGGSGGMAGLGGLALAGGLMGGFPGLQGQGGPQANAQRPPAASPQASQGQPINEMGSSEPSSPPMMGNGGSGGPLGPQPRNELTVQQQAQAAPG